ncbi:molybdopterin molybdenumtransferase MoeA, partial [Pseudomonadota bacterium]
MIEKVLVSLDEAIEIIIDNTPTLASERVSIQESLHRVLAEDIEAKRDHPPWNNSAMDGYAVQWQDIGNATPEAPASLKVVGEIQAGGMPNKTVQAGEAIQIMTGAPTPMGADTVVPVENTRQ